MPKSDCFSPEKSENGLNFIPKIQNSDRILSQKSKSRTEFYPKIPKSQSMFFQKSPKMDGKAIKNYQVISLPRLSTSEPYRMPSSRLSHPLRNRFCEGLLFTNRS